MAGYLNPAAGWDAAMGPNNIDAGYVKGFAAAKELGIALDKNKREEGYLNLAQHEDVRQERKLGMVEEKFGWERQEHDRQQFLQQGMAESFQQGGYEGVIDFLQQNDPAKAMEFHNAKLNLDKNIVQNDIMKTTVPALKAQAMVEGYSVLGKMGQALLQAPAEDRENMYQQMLPIVKTVNPNAPNALNGDAVNMFLLSAAQATPQNIIFGNKKQLVSAQSALGKLDVDIRDRINRGETVDNSPSLKTMIAEYQAHAIKADSAEANLTKQNLTNLANQTLAAKNQTQAAAAQYTLTANMNSKLQQESKGFIDFMEQKARFDGAIQAIASGASGAGQTAAMREVAMMFNKGQLGDRDVTAWENSDNQLQVIFKKLRSSAGAEGKVVLNPSELQRLNILMDTVAQSVTKKQTAINDRYKSMAQQFNVDPKNLAIYEPAAPAAYMDPSIPADLQAQAKAAISAGASPSAVNDRIKQIMSQGQQ